MNRLPPNAMEWMEIRSKTSNVMAMDSPSSPPRWPPDSVAVDVTGTGGFAKVSRTLHIRG